MTMQVYLEGYEDGVRTPRRFDLHEFPARIGRHPDCIVQLNVERISRRHAEIDRDCHGHLVIRDMASTNGTFVNGERIERPTAIENGDVIHIGDRELRLVEAAAVSSQVPDDQTRIGIGALPHDFPTRVREFNELLDQGLVAGYMQTITDGHGADFGHELLGRGAHPKLNAAPGELFALARALDMEVRLSELFRARCFADAHARGITSPLFFNTHPTECLNTERLMTGLRELRARYPSLALVFEVHEAAVTDRGMMAEVRTELRALNIELAYDDFGSGQARLLELVEVPPDYLKFDISLVSGIDAADSPRYRMLAALNTLIRDMGIRTLAEGVETADTARACREMGIDLLQGYLYGRPEPILPEPDRKRPGNS